jgi:hypothetical protein
MERVLADAAQCCGRWSNDGVADHRRSLNRLKKSISCVAREQRSIYTEPLDRLTRQRFHAAFAGIASPNAKTVALHESR